VSLKKHIRQEGQPRVDAVGLHVEELESAAVGTIPTRTHRIPAIQRDRIRHPARRCSSRINFKRENRGYKDLVRHGAKILTLCRNEHQGAFHMADLGDDL
jgi:hypothetical protein